MQTGNCSTKNDYFECQSVRKGIHTGNCGASQNRGYGVIPRLHIRNDSTLIVRTRSCSSRGQHDNEAVRNMTHFERGAYKASIPVRAGRWTSWKRYPDEYSEHIN